MMEENLIQPKQHQTLLVFDFDGTLCDSLPQLISAINELPRFFNVKRVTPSEVEYIRSLSSRKIMKFLKIRWYKLPFVIRRLKKSMRQPSLKLSLFDGVSGGIHQLKKQGFELAILSSNSKETILSKKSPEFLQCFSSIAGDCSPFKKSKELDKIREHYLAKGLKTFVYIGDETRDIKAAKKSGFKSVGVTWGYNNHETILSLSPDLVIQSVDSLAPSIKRFFT